MAEKGHAEAPLPLPTTLADGLHTLEVSGELFRVLVKTTPRGERIAVVQEAGVRCVLEDIMPLAEEKHIDVGVEGEQDVQFWVSELALIAVVKNLVDNVIRYTPDGGKVDLSVTTKDGCAILKIQDSGPGIQVTERERVFDPFYCLLGAIKSDQVWAFPSSRQFRIGLVLRFN